MVKFIHTADLHLSSPFKGLSHLPENLFKEIQDSTFNAFETIVDKAIEEAVDFILIAGDVFDLSSRSIKAQVFLSQQFSRLKNYTIEVFVSFGNHDYIVDERLYLDYPDNVHIFSETIETKYFQTKFGEKVAITGFSYGSQHITDNRMASFPRREEGLDYHIGLYHGDLARQASQYAPFTLDDLKRLHYHYFALGHIHKQGQVLASPPAYYSGNSQGRHINEAGDKGALLVTLSGSQHSSEFFSTSRIVWQAYTLDVTGEDSINTLISKIKDKMKTGYSESQDQQLVRLTFRFQDQAALDLLNQLSEDKLNQLLDNHRTWIASINHLWIGQENDLADLYADSWNQAVDKIDNDQINRYLADIEKQVPSQFIPDYRGQEDQDQLIEKAIQHIKQASQ